MKPQFSLNTLLFKWMTGSAVMCAVVVALVSAIGRAAAITLIIPLVAASSAVWGAWYIEQRVLERKSIRRSLNLTLLGISVWLITLIQLSFWLELPGAYGPVQYSTDAEGNVSFLFHVRVLTAFVVLACMIVAAAVGVSTIATLYEPSSVPKWRRCVIPILALAAFALAFQQFFSRGFFPTV